MWVGAQVRHVQHIYDNTPSLRTPLQISDERNQKAFADGTIYDEESDFDFAYPYPTEWSGPCLIMRASTNFATRDSFCTQTQAFFCEWRGKTDAF